MPIKHKEVYTLIEPVTEAFYRFLSRRRPDIPEEYRRQLAEFLAKIFVLAGYYGGGDALAGMILSNNVHLIPAIHRALNRLGAVNVPKPMHNVTWFLFMLKETRFNDPEIDAVLEALSSLTNVSVKPSDVREAIERILNGELDAWKKIAREKRVPTREPLKTPA